MHPRSPDTLRMFRTRCSVFQSCRDELFHYTSIDTLEKILEYRTIRFTRLDLVNDREEALSKEYPTAQTLVFASCWTDQDQESIPLWGVYNNFVGVRICMPTLMFNGMHDNHKRTNDDRFYEITVDPPLPGQSLFQVERRGDKAHFLSGNSVCGPTRVRYFEEAHQLSTQNHFPERAEAQYDLRDLGTRKHKRWEYEQEVRFRAFAVFTYQHRDLWKDFLSPDQIYASPVTTKYVDIPLDPRAIGKVGIVLGPRVNADARRRVEAACAKFVPSASVRPSAVPMR